MRRFFKALGIGATSVGLLYKPVRKAFAIDEVAEGIDFEKIPDLIEHNVFDMSLFSVTRERDLAKDIALNFNSRLGKIQVSQVMDATFQYHFHIKKRWMLMYIRFRQYSMVQQTSPPQANL